MRNFRKLNVWKKAMEIASDAYQAVKYLPEEEKFGLRSQITRAAISIPSNIAEGCSRQSRKMYVHFLEISLGSSFEMETQLLIASEMRVIPDSLQTKIQNDLSDFQRMMNKLISMISVGN